MTGSRMAAVTAMLLALALALALAVVPSLKQTASASIAGEPAVVASGLEWPWEVVLVPGGRILLTERPGRIRVIGADGVLQAAPAHESLGGYFLGLALHPSYETNKFVYLYNSYPVGGDVEKGRIQRFVDNGTTLTFSKTIIDGIPAELNHDGGRIKFGPDDKLYVTTGDAHDPDLPQDLESLAGKMLRLNAPGNDQDGTAPADNPFQSGTNSKFVWSYGHRHSQGFDWDAAGRLWATEHGPSGEAYAAGRCCRDELNLIVRGGNYGWPVIMGDEQQAGMQSPVLSSGDSLVWAPSGATFAADGHFYFSNLLGELLRDFTIVGTQVTEQREHFQGSFGRLRAAVAGRGALFLTTSNNGSDEKVLRVPIAIDPGPEDPLVPGADTDNAAPEVLGFRFLRRTFRAARKGASVARKNRPVGTRVRYRLSEAATAKFRVERAAKGRRKRGKCIIPNRRNREARRCTRYRRVKGTFSHEGSAGLNSVRFTGRVRGKKLRPARYRLVMVASDPAGNRAKPERAKFRVVRR